MNHNWTMDFESPNQSIIQSHLERGPITTTRYGYIEKYIVKI